MSDTPQTVVPLGLNFTNSAAKKAGLLIAEEENSELKLRVFVTGGGCSGFTYVFDFDNSPGEFDEVFESLGIKVICDKKSLLYIDGTEVDFKTTLLERGFVFVNDGAVSSCGCGTSFMPKDEPEFEL